MPKIFLSYTSLDEPFVKAVDRYLRSQPGVHTWFWPDKRVAQNWPDQIQAALGGCDSCCAFVSDKLGDTQSREMASAAIHPTILHRAWVQLTDSPDLSAKEFFQAHAPVRLEGDSHANCEAVARRCAQELLRLLASDQFWIEPDDVPVGYPFNYERRIVDAFAGEGTPDEIRHIPGEWPDVFRWSGETYTNLIPKEVIGEPRDPSRRIRVVARAESDLDRFTLPEAGPRHDLFFPTHDRQRPLRVGILVSGGIAPGINAVIRGIWDRHHLYAHPQGTLAHKVQVTGYLEGFRSLLHNQPVGPAVSARLLDRDFVEEHANRGGSMIGTSRAKGLLDPNPASRLENIERVVRALDHELIDILYVIGGDGSMRAAHAIFTIAKQLAAEKKRGNRPLSVVGVPKTMDNDILWVWQSFGFLSAVEKARETILNLQTEVQSNPRLAVVQLFGSDSGFVAAHAVAGSGGCDFVLVPEVPFVMKTLCDHMCRLLKQRRTDEKKPYGLVVMAEAAIPVDALDHVAAARLSEPEITAIEHFESHGRRVRGQTPDELRTAGFKIVSSVLQNAVRRINAHDAYWEDFRVLTNEPRHIIRAVPPSVSDVIFGQRLGALAVDNAMAGYSDFMVSQWLTEYVLVPLKLVVLGRKRVPPDGIFWKTVLASTDQPDSAPDVAAYHRTRQGGG